MTALSLSQGVSLPLEAVTETFAILGRRGSGKTHTASVLAEGMLRAGLNVVILDPLDVWWGLRSSADGKGDGFPVVVFGGEHGDLPLEASAGRYLADVIVEDEISAILSVRHLSKTEQRRFVGDFAERLYRRKAQHKHPLHLVVDEADAFVPQRLLPGGEAAYGAIDSLVRRGRSSGVGTTLISQRAAVIAKDVLTQTEVLVCHQTNGPQDRKALEAWIEANDSDDRRGEFMASLASLKVGEAWLWSPSWLKVFRRVQVRPRTTFDSSSTPKVGAKLVAPKSRAAIDLAAISEHLAAMAKVSENLDPRRLRARIAELEAKLAAPIVTRPMFDAAAFSELGQAIEEDLRLAFNNIRGALHGYMSKCLQEAKAKPGSLIGAPVGPGGVGDLSALVRPVSAPLGRGYVVPTPSPKASKTASDGAGPANLGKCARQLLTALAQHGTLSLTQAAIIAGYSAHSGGVRNSVGALRTAGFVEGGNDAVTATSAGIGWLGHYEPLPTGRALAEYWYEQLGKASAEILRVLVEAYPRAVDLRTAAAKCGYSETSGGVRNATGRLRTLELITGGNDAMTASERLVDL